MDLADRREQYEEAGLDVGDVDDDPILQFEEWYACAAEADLFDANGMVLSVVDAAGWPTARYVLLKAVDHRGFSFWTNMESEKAKAIVHSGRGSLTFGWLPIRRQVRIQGTISHVAREEDDEYFAGRPRGSQLSAWASPQSHVVNNRADLQQRYADVEERFGERDIPCPPFWGGYRVKPEMVEFWQGRPNRFHDRIRYTRTNMGWDIERLAP